MGVGIEDGASLLILLLEDVNMKDVAYLIRLLQDINLYCSVILFGNL